MVAAYSKRSWATRRLPTGSCGRAGQANRDATVYARLLLGACAELGAGRIELDSLGDCSAVIDAYRELGFEIVESTGGWQLQLD